jgi:hypothetical protein
MPPSQYEIPLFGTPADRLLGWCLEAQGEGEAWLKTQGPTRGWDADLRMLSAPDGDPEVAGMSNTGYNKGKRVARELVASLANFRHAGEFKVTWDQSLYDQAHTLSNLDRNWWSTTYAHAEMRRGLQFAVGLGTTYLWETWDKHFWSPYRGDIRLQALNAQDVTFVQLPKDHNIQRAYAVIIREELPINLAKAVYGETNRAFAEGLKPDRETPGWLQKGLQKVQQFLSPALRVAGRMQKDNVGSFPTVDIFHMYTLDRSINESPFPVQMGPWRDGKPLTNWSYKVPALGDPVPQEKINPETGNPFTLPATPENCRLFPLRRYTIFSRTGVCYDDTAPNWHGDVPLARIRFNDWAWEALGSSLVGETRTMQQGIEALMRMIEDSAAARLDPPMIYDDTRVAQSWAQSFNPRKAGARAGADLNAGDLVKYPVDPGYYNVPPWIPDWIKQQEDRIDYMTGVRDLVAVAKAQQIPGADTLEKLMEMAGPIVQDLVRALEQPLQQLGDWRKAYYYQFYTRQRMLTVTGPEGVDHDVLYVPEQLIPLQGLTDPETGQWAATESAADRSKRIAGDSPEQRNTRLRRSLDDFRYEVTESGINEIHRMSTKLFYIQLMKVGFPISWWTFAKIAQIPNFGPPPEGTNTEMERWVAQKRIEMDLQLDLQEQAQARMGMPPGGEGEIAPGGTPGNAPGGGAGPGRPQSFQKPPRLESKDGGARSTITTA